MTVYLIQMDTWDAIVQNICTHELLIKRKTQLDQLSEGLSSLGFTNFLSMFGEELKCLFVRRMCVTLTTEDLLSLIVPVPQVPEQGAGSKTYEYLMTYVRILNEMGKSYGIINPWHMHRKVTVVVLCVCVSICYQASCYISRLRVQSAML